MPTNNIHAKLEQRVALLFDPEFLLLSVWSFCACSPCVHVGSLWDQPWLGLKKVTVAPGQHNQKGLCPNHDHATAIWLCSIGEGIAHSLPIDNSKTKICELMCVDEGLSMFSCPLMQHQQQFENKLVLEEACISLHHPWLIAVIWLMRAGWWVGIDMSPIVTLWPKMWKNAYWRWLTTYFINASPQQQKKPQNPTTVLKSLLQ